MKNTMKIQMVVKKGLALQMLQQDGGQGMIAQILAEVEEIEKCSGYIIIQLKVDNTFQNFYVDEVIYKNKETSLQHAIAQLQKA